MSVWEGISLLSIALSPQTLVYAQALRLAYRISRCVSRAVLLDLHIQYNPGYNDLFCPAIRYRYNQFIVITKIEIIT